MAGGLGLEPLGAQQEKKPAAAKKPATPAAKPPAMEHKVAKGDLRTVVSAL